MTRSIFDPTGGDTERSGSRFTGPDAQQDSHMPPEVTDGVVDADEEVPLPGVTEPGMGEAGMGEPGVGEAGRGEAGIADGEEAPVQPNESDPLSQVGGDERPAETRSDEER